MPAGPTERSVRRRVGLPGSRAVLGGFLVAAAALGVLAVVTGATQGPARTWVVARHPLAPGTLLTTDDLALVAADLPDVVARSAFGDPAAVLGARTLAPLGEGELVQATALRHGTTDAPFEVTLGLPSAQTLDGRLRPGETVDVLATFGTGDAATTETVVLDALVTAVSADPRSLSGQQVAVTLAAADRDAAAALAHAGQAAEVTLVRATPGVAGPDGPDDPAAPAPEARP